MKSFKAIISVSWMLLLAVVFSASTQAAAPTSDDPQVVVESVTKELFSLVKAKNLNKSSDEAYFGQVETTLNDVVDFPFIAKHVMGERVFGRASKDQRAKFLEVFRDGLVKSYAKGIAGYADSNVKVIGVVRDKRNPKRAAVHQEVSESGTTHQLDYTMVQGASGQWKLINVTLNGVNLGVSFQGQFKAAMRKYKNNLDQVIANWLADA